MKVVPIKIDWSEIETKLHNIATKRPQTGHTYKFSRGKKVITAKVEFQRRNKIYFIQDQEIKEIDLTKFQFKLVK